MADNVQLLQAIIEQAKATGDSPGAIVFLDLCKAYDSMDREFLWQVLADFGYPAQFITMLQNLHTDTMASFLVNGEVSDATDVRTGIRQGCPLTPLLFLIAVEALKHAVDQTEGLEGVTLAGAIKNHVHNFSAFVDDSVVCLKDRNMIKPLEDTLNRYAAVSGLRSFPVLAVGETLEYLGVRIGWRDLQRANWDHRLATLRKRLGFLSQFTTGIQDRVQILNLAAIPSILFTAAYVGPTPEHCSQLDALWRQYIWHGTTTTRPQRAHKIATDIITLPRESGGLGLADYRLAFIKQAAKTLLRWHARTHDKYWEATNYLLAQQVNQPTKTIRVYPAHQLQSTTIKTDKTLKQAYLLLNATMAHYYAAPPALTRDKSEFLRSWPRPWLGFRWLTTRTFDSALDAATPSEVKTYWTTFPWTDNVWITDADAQPLKRSAFARYQHETLSQVQLVRTAPGTFRFKDPRPASTRISQAATRKLATWASFIITSHPSLPDDPAPAHERVYPTHAHSTFSQYEWTASTQGVLTGHRLHDKWFSTTTELPREAQCPGWMEPVAWIVDAPEQPILLAGYPTLQHGPTFLPLLDKLPPKRATIKTIVHRLIAPLITDLHSGLQLLKSRLEHQLERQPELAQPLQATKLSSLLRPRWGVSSEQLLFWYRLTVGALNTRDQQGMPMACPHEFCKSGPPLSTAHILWYCAGATPFWRELHTRWTGRRAAPDDELRTNIFSREAPRVSSSIHTSILQHLHSISAAHRQETDLWVLICTAAAQTLWLTRNQAAFQDQRVTTAAGLAGLLWKTTTKLLDSFATPTTNTNRARAIAVVAAYLRADDDHVATTTAEMRLYFDGGSRGNPGTAGSGSVLVSRAKPDSTWNLLWWDWCYIGDQATNNEAEHTGLMRGLETSPVFRNQHTTTSHLTIIGDSQLVLSQLTGAARCNDDKLKRLLLRSQTALRADPNYTVLHTLRTGNQLADWLSNQAIDKKTTATSTTTWTETDTILTTMLPNVDKPEFMRPTPQRHLIADIDTKLERHIPHRTRQRRKRPD